MSQLQDGDQGVSFQLSRCVIAFSRCCTWRLTAPPFVVNRPQFLFFFFNFWQGCALKMLTDALENAKNTANNRSSVNAVDTH